MRLTLATARGERVVAREMPLRALSIFFHLKLLDFANFIKGVFCVQRRVGVGGGRRAIG